MPRSTELLFKQYELMVNSANQVTNWRQTANNFYLTVNTTILAVASYLYGSTPLMVEVISMVGIVISILWRMQVVSYGKLNGAKFKVIHEMEKSLPIEMYRLEEGYNKEKFRGATKIEGYIPILFIIAYAIVFLKLVFLDARFI